MNFLAHLYLAAPSPELMVGGLLGDFRKGVDLSQLSPLLQEGVALHLEIDRFTDAHPVVLQSKRRILPEYSRYSGVLVDLFYDHYLAVDWERYSTEALPVFADRAYGVLEEASVRMPEPMQRAIGSMRRHDWFGSYARVEGIETAISRIALRLRRSNSLATGGSELRRLYEPLREDFHAFFPELKRHVSHRVLGREER